MIYLTGEKPSINALSTLMINDFDYRREKQGEGGGGVKGNNNRSK